VAEAGLEREGTVGRARARLLGVRPLVEFATVWFAEHRGPESGGGNAGAVGGGDGEAAGQGSTGPNPAGAG
jgi:hypothetical protein